MLLQEHIVPVNQGYSWNFTGLKNVRANTLARHMDMQTDQEYSESTAIVKRKNPIL